MSLPPRVARRCLLLLSAAVVATALTPDAARAERADGEKPIVWSGDRLTGRKSDGGTDVVEVEGKVVITQGTRTIKADRAVIRQNPDGTMSASAYGNPVSFREKRDGAAEYIEAYALRAEYDGRQKLLELFDQALLRREGDELRAGYISYNTETEAYRAEGQRAAEAKGPATSGGRVQGVFQPKSKDSKDGKSDPSPLRSSPTLKRATE